MDLITAILRLKDDIRAGNLVSEAAVSQGAVLPILQALGWPVFDTKVVSPEFAIQSRAVDFALCHPPNKPVALIEVKRIGNTEGADRQLFEYAFHEGVPLLVLTDGQEWSFYLPSGRGSYAERRVYKLDLLERDDQTSADRLVRYLDYPRVVSNQAMKDANADYESVSRHRQAERMLPEAWNQLLESQDELLIEMLVEKVEDLTGFKPNLEAVSSFVEGLPSLPLQAEVPPAQTPRPRSTPRRREPVSRKSSTATGFRLGTKRFPADSARDVMISLFMELASRDNTFLDRFLARKHGRKRRYLAKDKYELYPDRPDLAESESVEIVPGWWVGTNYSRRSIRVIVELAAEVAGLDVGGDFSFDLE